MHSETSLNVACILNILWARFCSVSFHISPRNLCVRVCIFGADLWHSRRRRRRSIAAVTYVGIASRARPQKCAASKMERNLSSFMYP